ncbi:unnamed protein product [Acanthoscelides obtectus]|uniref:Uncharacterized protein n=1 Tax=Acanthoscelides obtectus TaxID=200917 RepID=A0A9P0KDZ9_ACAOB|nr:unnamed protein product [Acanthoscelides obtectus]CAK1676485.1 hypothetical protein AOBTE_LOCUS30785 [Acanthoscelides obtectus]
MGIYCPIEDDKSWGTTTFRTINASVKCFFLCCTADRVSEEIRSTGLAIYKVDTQEIRIMDELEVISLHMLNSKGEIEAAG